MRPERKKSARKVLCTVVLYASLVLISVLLIPVCLALIPVVIVWRGTDKLLRWLE